jgi:hypothetical protein
MCKDKILEEKRLERVAKAKQDLESRRSCIREQNNFLDKLEYEIVNGTVSLDGLSFQEWTKKYVLPLISSVGRYPENCISNASCAECDDSLDDQSESCIDCDNDMHPECFEENEFCYRCRNRSHINRDRR